jgi:hypothetical protein
MDHISAKHKLAWCCPQYYVIDASNILVTIHLTEGSNKIDDLLKDYHDYFPIQLIGAYH